jgi:hypothetical protein
VNTPFAKIACRIFQFLEYDYGFERVLATDECVRWQRDNMYVQIRYDVHRSREILLEVGQVAVDADYAGPPFTLGEVLGVSGLALADRPLFQASTVDRLEGCIETIAQLVQEHATFLFDNEVSLFVTLTRQRRLDCVEYSSARDVKWLREAADVAWKEKDYESVVHLYGHRIAELSEVERKRYSIAMRHTQR